LKLDSNVDVLVKLRPDVALGKYLAVTSIDSASLALDGELKSVRRGSTSFQGLRCLNVMADDSPIANPSSRDERQSDYRA
jgi:hypothetical protein